MSDEERPDEPKREQRGDASADEETGDPRASTSEDLSGVIADSANRWLKERFQLEEDAEGHLHLPDFERYTDMGERAEQFIKGFFRGFIAKTPAERAAEDEGRAAEEAPQATEVMARLLRKVNDTIAGSFHGYLKEHAAPEAAPDESEGGAESEADGEAGEDKPHVTIDGRFVREHGASLLGAIVGELGRSFQDEGKGVMDDAGVTPEGAGEAAGERAAEEAHTEPLAATAPVVPPDERVDVDVDMGSILRALLGLK